MDSWRKTIPGALVNTNNNPVSTSQSTIITKIELFWSDMQVYSLMPCMIVVLFTLTRVSGTIYGLRLLQSLFCILFALVDITQVIVDYTQVAESGGNCIMVFSIDTFFNLQGSFIYLNAFVVLPMIFVSNPQVATGQCNLRKVQNMNRGNAQ